MCIPSNYVEGYFKWSLLRPREGGGHVVPENDWNRTAWFYNSNEPAGIEESKSFNSLTLIRFFFFFFLPKNYLCLKKPVKGQVLRFSVSIAYYEC